MPLDPQMSSSTPTPLRRRAFLSAATAGLIALALPAGAASIIDGASEGPAIDGYDTVAYHVAGKPIKGDARFSTEWQGAKWHFASAENLQKFQAEPELYAPQYGGYCAYAMSNDDFASGDPNRWKVVEGKLYLNANFFAQKLWQTDIPGKIKSGDANWPGKRRELEAKK